MERPLLKVWEVADMLSLHTNHVYLLISQDKIPGVVRIGGAIRINRAKLESWIAGGEAKVKS